MKKLTLIPILMFLFYGCGGTTDTSKNSTDRLSVDLEKFNDFLSSLNTRSLGGLPNVELIVGEAVAIAEQNNIQAIVDESPYYKASNEDIFNSEEVDIYDVMNWMYENSTPEYIAAIETLWNESAVEEERFIPQNIIQNAKLLPNEKLALLTISNAGFIIKIAHHTKESCDNTFDKNKSRCLRNYAIDLGAGVLIGIGTGAIGGIIAIGVAEIRYSTCMSDAEEDWHDCLNSIH